MSESQPESGTHLGLVSLRQGDGDAGRDRAASERSERPLRVDVRAEVEPGRLVGLVSRKRQRRGVGAHAPDLEPDGGHGHL